MALVSTGISPLSEMRVLALIPARGGSKGVPRKNAKLLCGKPLIQYTIEAALGAHSLTRVMLSTDDAEIAEIGRRCGVDVPFVRPSNLADDDTPTLPVIQHAVRYLEALGDIYHAVCLLQPTNPLRQSEDIEACIALFQSSNASSVISVLQVPHHYNPHWVYFRDSENFLHLSTNEATPIARRQELPPSFHRDGSVYLVRRDVLINENTLYGNTVVGYLMPLERTMNIDTVDDWRTAEQRVCAKASGDTAMGNQINVRD